jgi:hypothetical protein
MERPTTTSIIVVAIAVFLVGGLAVMGNTGPTGAVTYSGGDRSCTINSRTYERCMTVTMSQGETAITSIPWAAKTATGAAKFVKDNVPGADTNKQASAWIDLSDWLNNKIYDATPEALRDLSQYYNWNRGRTQIMVAWNYRVSDSWWGGDWKWVDVYYDFYYESNSGYTKYASSNTGFYYNTATGEISYY